MNLLFLHLANYSNKQKTYKSGYGNKHTWTKIKDWLLKRTLLLFLNY